MSELFRTQRQRVLDLYKEAGQPFIASTQPYHSTRAIRFEVVEVDITNGIAWAVAAANQSLDFFTYGVGDRIVLGNQANYQATEAETNLAKGKSTNGASDYVIEGVGLHCRAMLVEYASGSSPLAVSPTNQCVVDAVSGLTPIIDPASIIMPPQGQSPANLEQPLFQSITPFLSLEFEWDRKRVEKLGVCDILPQAGAASYLRTNGEPRSDNRYQIPEGYIWRRDGEPDGEFAARVRLQRCVACPINLRTLVNDATTFKSPSDIQLELTMRVYGLEVQLPSSN
jgi:hypothetical protein